MKKHFTTTFAILVMAFSFSALRGQQALLQPGFDAEEYADALWLAFYGFTDSLKDRPMNPLRKGVYERKFRSPEVGLYNMCEVYLRSDSTIILSLRGKFWEGKYVHSRYCFR